MRHLRLEHPDRQHLRHLHQFRQVFGLRHAFRNHKEAGLRRQQLVTERKRQLLLVVFEDIDTGLRGQTGNVRQFGLHRVDRTTGTARIGQTGRRLWAEPGEQVHRVTGKQCLRERRLPQRRHIPRQFDRLDAGLAQAVELGKDFLGHALLGGDQFAGAAGGPGDLADEALGDRRADAHREHPMTGAERALDDRLVLPDLAVGDEEDRRSATRAGFGNPLLEGAARLAR